MVLRQIGGNERAWLNANDIDRPTTVGRQSVGGQGLQSGTEAERTAYAPPRGRDRGHVAGLLRAGAASGHTFTQGTGSSRIVIQPTLGEPAGCDLPRRGAECAPTGTGQYSFRTTS